MFYIYRWGARNPIMVAEGPELEVVKFCVENNLQWSRWSYAKYGTKEY
jgi:hypothetical protein